VNVLTITSLYPNNVNPTLGVFIRERLRHVARRCEVTVVAPVPYFPKWLKVGRWSAYSEVERSSTDGAIPVYHPRYLVTPKVGMSFYGDWYYLGVKSLASRLVSERSIEVIDAHYLYPDGLAAVRLGDKLGLPVVVSARGTDVNLYPDFRTIRPLLRRVLKQATFLVSVSNALAERMVQLGAPENRLRVIPNGVDENIFFPEPRDKARARLGLPPGDKMVLGVGRLVPEKGFQCLLESCRAAEAEGEPFRVVLVGEGPMGRELERRAIEGRIRDRVRLAGLRPFEELRYWYSAADLLCVPSYREGCPNVLLEAAACGIPAVSRRIGDIDQRFEERGLGITFEGGTEELLRALRRAMEVDWRTETIVEQARRRTWARVAEEQVRVFEEAIELKRKDLDR